MEIKGFNFIQDKPILPGDTGYFSFYHEYFSPALKDMVLSDTCPHTIGLFSKWGSGKSSIIDQLSVDIKTEKGTNVFVFDAWKYQEDSLRRTFLIKLEKFLVENKYDIPKNILSSFYSRKTTSVATPSEVFQQSEKLTGNIFRKTWGLIKRHKVILSFLVFPLAIVIGFQFVVAYHPQNRLVVAINASLVYLNTLVWLAFFLKPIAEKALEKVTSKIFESTKTYTEIRTQVEEEDRLNSPEQFENVFNEMIKTVKEGKLVIVFDNIDRVQGDIALKILSTIKTFLDPIEKSKVIFIVPCDSDAINKQIVAFYNNQKSADFDESEYLKKLFNVILHTPEFIDADLQQYTTDLIDQTGDIKNIINKEDVVSVITKAFNSNPREVKQFINNLVSAVLVASKTTVADHILSEENIAYFTKVTILKQKFPEAYKKLKENWNEPEKIFDTENVDSKLRDFLTLTSPTTTDDAEPFIYFKTPAVERDLTDPKAIRKSLIDGNVEEFGKLVSVETKKDKLSHYITLLLKNYKAQPRILLSIFKTQIQGFWNLKEEVKNKEYLENSAVTVEIIWNNYLDLPTELIFALLQKITDKNKRVGILDRFIAVLSNEEIKIDSNKTYLLNLIDEFIKNFSLFTVEQKLKIVEALRQNFVGRVDVLMKFNTLEIQNSFIHADTLRNIIQENLTNETLKDYLPVINLYKEFIINSNLSILLVQKIPQLLSLENAQVPTTTDSKIVFYNNLLGIFRDFGKKIKEMAVASQLEIFTGLSNGFDQSGPADGLRTKAVNGLRWLETLSSDANTKAQVLGKIDGFILQASRSILENVLNYWTAESRINFLEAHFKAIKSRAIQDDGILDLSYELGSEDQKLKLMQFVITSKSDHGVGFLSKLGDKIPERQKIIDALLVKIQPLPIDQRVDVLNFLKGKIARNDDVNIKQTAIKQIFEYLKSNNQAMVQFGVTLLKEKFLSDSDEREIAKEMIEFYNNRNVLQHYDLPVIEHLAEIEAKLQDVLKGKLVYLILSNISSDREHSIQRPLISYILKMNADSELYEKDYGDLMERLLTWADSEQKEIVVNDVVAMLKSTSGTKAKEYLKKINHLIKVPPVKESV